MNDAPTILLAADLPETRRLYGPQTYSTENLRVLGGFQRVSTQLLDYDIPIMPYPRADARFIAPTWLIGEFERMIRPTPEQQAERAKRQAEHERRRAAWWATLTRTQRFHIANRRRRARARTKISDVRANVALKIAPWLDDRDW